MSIMSNQAIKENIMVVEDDAIIALKLKDSLLEMGYRVSAMANSGDKAVELAIKEQPDLILMDIHLKGEMDGIEAAERIRSQLEVPVIFMSAYSDKNKIMRAKQTLPSGYIVKPFQDRELAINIEMALYVAKADADRKIAEKERQLLQQHLFKNQKLESLGTLAGGIAHDFNNLLFQISGNIQIAKKKLSKTDISLDNLSNALNACYRAKDLTQQILTFSRREEGELKPMDIQPMVKEALKLLRSSIPATIEMKSHIDSESGLVHCDPTQITQIVMNLCTNAYQAMKETGGLLEIALKNRLITPDDSLSETGLTPGNYLELIVADTGVGIKPETVDRIFDPYFTTKTQDEGSGLGLSIVHGIIENHKGKIQVTSEPGVGSRFKVYLPVVESIETKPKLRQAMELVGGTEQILIIDDDRSIVGLEQEFLVNLGYQVKSFTNSAEALAAFKADPMKFDLVLTDQTMPHFTGADLSRKMMTIRPDIPIILLTGYSELINQKDARAKGIKQFLTKPVDLNQLAVAIRTVLDEQSE